ncbi:HD domain-containing protein [Bradyrhizobium sp. U87765 SZCCT0131]|uniref:HD domain-containing protein n=1 Tax=unclassified Bradyrhizobium TaxID=2631580 RepID=UPI001BADF7D5|nr:MULTISPECIES: HD domain-containing protein [unclassified Bradyrhizobium]MBR1219950.1 HD domain-containing protein [Bradyrhizobium sp. U87765 SZCCT0131]MBR1263594.1 HD domain-containing protein [Bradyrhizobium sp. U87765 SZCCT0134]MBR1309163.1 HD domain-containing protein [Bradyrhizobium sp. U87765 SZCCT0110]MBR1323926.1 HD domain-containing protein [Bradyrhizobium sp. U87765 SZCCT0109]MBR1349478.1 HD domain-containing protein [Bradyrhizobium sp. U87765 SZCCT0048]
MGASTRRKLGHSKLLRPQRIRDPIHDLIEFNDQKFEQMCWRLIQTPVFQRLRRIKQLGFSELVYPGATHSRFSHSIGVFHTARNLANMIERDRSDAFDRRRSQVAIAAALLHDLGHGPFSHAFEEVLKKLGFGKHEATSVRLIKNGEVAQILNDFAPNFASSVSQIIENKVPEDIYAAIVSSQFDADRLDYMRRDRLMTGAQSSAIDFKWLAGNLEVRRVKVGQDEQEVREVETLVVGQKAVLAAEAYVLGLFHLYPTVYFHKATRAAEKIFAALLLRVFQLARSDRCADVGLQADHPLVRFAQDPNDLGRFCCLDDSSVWGALPLLVQSKNSCIAELSSRLIDRRFYKAIDVTAKIELALAGLPLAEREEKRRKAEASIRVDLNSSGLLAATDEAPRVFDDTVVRDPYRQGQGDGAVLDAIYAIDRSGELKELSHLSPVVAALKKFEVYRIYYRESDEATKKALDNIIEGYCHA